MPSPTAEPDWMERLSSLAFLIPAGVALLVIVKVSAVSHGSYTTAVAVMSNQSVSQVVIGALSFYFAPFLVVATVLACADAVLHRERRAWGLTIAIVAILVLAVSQPYIYSLAAVATSLGLLVLLRFPLSDTLAAKLRASYARLLVATVLIAMIVAATFFDNVWLPAERLTYTAGGEEYGWVLKETATDLVILQGGSRIVERRAIADVLAREFCTVVRVDVPPLIPVFSHVEYPDCK